MKTKRIIKRTKPKIYLAGYMSDWRVEVKSRLEKAGAEVLIPADNPQQSAALYVKQDLDMAAECDAMLAVIPQDHHARGTHAEMGVAYHAGKPIYLVWQDLPLIYSFSATMAFRVYTEIDPAIEDLIAYIKTGIMSPYGVANASR